MEDKDLINAVEGFTITNMFPLLGSAICSTMMNTSFHNTVKPLWTM